MASIKDVAKLAHVGVGTVSRMINNSGYVAEETRKKIEAAMAELDYTPNELARNLYRKRSGIIAILVPKISSPFFSEFINYAEAELYESGYKTMVCSTTSEKSAEKEYLDMLDRHIVDGIITGVHTLDVTDYEKLHKPIVALDRYLGEGIPVVTVNHKEGGRIAAEELIRNGCRKVLHFKGDIAVGSPYHDRHNEFDRVMARNKIQTVPFILERNRMDSAYYRNVIQDVFSGSFAYDGVFAVDDLAIECMNAVIRNHMRIPRDVRIIAYDGTFITDLAEPQLTAIVQPIAELAHECVRLIEEQISGKKPADSEVVLKVRLRQGRTTFPHSE